MKILLVNYMETTSFGGINKVVRELAKNLSQKHKVKVLQLNPFGLSKKEIYEGFEIIRIGSKMNDYLYGFSPKIFFYLKKYIKQFAPDIIHVHGYHSLFSMQVIWVSKKIQPKLPIIFSPHFGIYSHSSIAGKLLWRCYNKLIGQYIAKIVDYIVVASEYEKTTLEKELKVKKDKIFVIPHGVNIIKATKNVNKETNIIKLVYGGYLLKIKGIHYILYSIKELISTFNFRNVRLEIIGEGPYKRKLQTITKNLGLDNFVFFRPALDYKEFLEQIEKANIFLLLSEGENYGITVAEALALGTPVIVTERAALKEFLNEPGCFGVSYPPNPKEVAKLILKIINSDVRLGPFSKKIRKWEEIIKDYERVYMRALRCTQSTKKSKKPLTILASSPFCGITRPKSGAQNRFSNLLKQLRNHDNKIIVLESKKFFSEKDRKLGKIYTYRDINLPTMRDFNFHFILNLAKILKVEDVDLIQFSHPSGIFIAKLMTKIMGKEIPIVYDAHNVESDFVVEVIAKNPEYLGIKKRIIPLYIWFLEKFACKYFADHIICVSSRDQKTFIEKYQLEKKKITVIPSGCFLPSLPDIKKECLKKRMGIDSNKLVIFFHGSYSHPPNKEAVTLIKKYIAPKFKGDDKILFVIGGEGIPKFNQGNIKSLGYIKDLYTTMSIADIAIVPIRRGGGTKLKVLDYLAMGLPIVTTKKGIEGIEAEKNKHVIIVDDVNEEFIESIKYLVENQKERERLGRNARKLAEEKYEWRKIGKKLNMLYEKIIAGYPYENL